MMRILYVAKHDSGYCDDEGAIVHAIEQLGHKVERLTEKKGRWAKRMRGDFLLFHKWYDPDALQQVRMPKVFWYFDLVNTPDPTLAGRCATRMNWMREIIPRVDLGFCTDGDWVHQDQSGKLVKLCQGADERVMGMDDVVEELWLGFTGLALRVGGQRASFVQEMQGIYGPWFYHVPTGVYGKQMARLVARTRIMVAPDSPITDNYASNRAYNTLGFGGFLLHPWCASLANHYHHREEIVFYQGREDLHEKIRCYLECPDERRRIAEAGYKRTLAEHTYRHRVQGMLQVIQERLNIT